jgi:hypothetical protein
MSRDAASFSTPNVNAPSPYHEPVKAALPTQVTSQNVKRLPGAQGSHSRLMLAYQPMAILTATAM